MIPKECKRLERPGSRIARTHELGPHQKEASGGIGTLTDAGR